MPGILVSSSLVSSQALSSISLQLLNFQFHCISLLKPASVCLLSLSKLYIPASVSALSFLWFYLFDKRNREYFIFLRSTGSFFIQVSLTKRSISNVASFENVNILVSHVAQCDRKFTPEEKKTWILASEWNTLEMG